MKFIRYIVATALLFVLSCHPFARFWPDKLSNDEQVTAVDLPVGARVEVIIDNFGVPHIYGDNEEDLSYALGFMHGRDRRFQLLAIKHAASGRLSEIFGKRTLDMDRMLRMLSFNADAQYQALADRDKKIMLSYSNGVNRGIKTAGRTIEETLLGVELEAFKPIDCLLIARLQAWELNTSYLDELARLRMFNSGSLTELASSVLFEPIWSANVPVMAQGTNPLPTLQKQSLPLPKGEGLKTKTSSVEIPAFFVDHAAIGSNSYVVSGKYTQSGKPVLCNDPHLEHRAPSVFYLARLESPGFSVTGATFPGLPAILIGRGRSIAWGVTASYADLQDLVRLKTDPSNPQDYFVDGKKLSLTPIEQPFVYGSDSDEVLVEKWNSSIFGLVLPPVFEPLKDNGEQLALQWGGFAAGDVNRSPISGFWDLARASNINDATNAIDKFSFAGISVILAFNDGTIGYRLAALMPPKRSEKESYLPKDGSSSSALWTTYVPMSQRPSETNPEKGFVVAANQRIVEQGNPMSSSIGTNSGSWSRALRINERIDALLKSSDKVSSTALLAIQQDTVAPEAQLIAPILARYCPRKMPNFSEALTTQFCNAIANFDGDFTTESGGALPYAYFIAALRSIFLREHFGDDVAKQVESRLFSQLALTQALVQKQLRAFNDETKVKNLVVKAAPLALKQLAEESGSSPKKWTWGKHHTLKSRGALYEAPIIGGFFATNERAQGGSAQAPRAEAGLPVRAGAVMRMVVDMNDPYARMVLDSGNGGTPGHKHFEDMNERWNLGDPFVVVVEKDTLRKDAEEHFWLSGARR